MNPEYRRMEKAIRFIESNLACQPRLEEIAGHVGLSPFHFQKQFRKWTGVSPKRYLQFLTVQSAKELLRRSLAVLDTAFEVGLSGSGRLHDLFVSVEAVTPGQFKGGGRGMVVRYGYCDSPFGRCMLALTDRGVCDLGFVEEGREDTAELDLGTKWKSADLVRDDQRVNSAAGHVFKTMAGHGGKSPKLDLRGTNFQIKVWQALLKIPEGAVVSYSGLAERIGRPDAVRAVAGAVGRNPVAWLIPCHRVLRSSGELGGYRWGVERKRMMLARELAGDA